MKNSEIQSVEHRNLQHLDSIREELLQLEHTMVQKADGVLVMYHELHPLQYASARNLLHYLSLRSEDMRGLQDKLHASGLSSLASSEGHIRAQVQAILELLGQTYTDAQRETCTYARSQQLKHEKRKQLFGQYPSEKEPAYMVTFETGMADDFDKVKSLLKQGMGIARINCAHDNPDVWAAMVRQLRRASAETGIPCKVYMDLAGPKIRTVLLGKGHKAGEVKVKEGQLIWLAYSKKGFGKEEVVISPNEPHILDKLKVGERVYIDDGTIKARVLELSNGNVGIRILRIASDKRRIKAGKGINFPDSFLALAPLTHYDVECLPFVCAHADMVGYSFVGSAVHLALLEQHMAKITAQPPALILKIETPDAVRNLPQLLLEGMKRPAFGVMIARGDLAVEIGFERMGEIQEEILWICESAHVPVIWATQVLDHLNKTGLATRSEITDAGHAVLCECVMVNKGKYLEKVLETLRDIARRAGEHRLKKRYIFRPLGIARHFLGEPLVRK